MAKYNKSFDISLSDMELIETALRTAAANDNRLDPTAVHDLLGRLHNQKVFYRPNEGVYVSG